MNTLRMCYCRLVKPTYPIIQIVEACRVVREVPFTAQATQITTQVLVAVLGSLKLQKAIPSV